MGRPPDLQSTLQAMELLRCELQQSQQTNAANKSSSAGRNVVLSSGLITALMGGAWGWVEDQAAKKVRGELAELKKKEDDEALDKRLEATEVRLEELMDVIRKQAVDNFALATHLSAKLDAVSSRARRVATPIAVEAAEARAARFRIGD